MFASSGRCWILQEREEIRERRVVESTFPRTSAFATRPLESPRYGLQNRVTLGRAFAMDPTLLHLDRPMAGMNIEEKGHTAPFVLEVQEKKGVAVMLIEHDKSVGRDLAERIVVLDVGRKLADGQPETVRGDERVVRADGRAAP